MASNPPLEKKVPIGTAAAPPAAIPTIAPPVRAAVAPRLAPMTPPAPPATLAKRLPRCLASPSADCLTVLPKLSLGA